MPKRLDLVGHKYGRLTVLSKAGKNHRGEVSWKCHCDCGTLATVRAGHLRSGNTQACGCLGVERHKAAGEANRTHGHSQRTRTYTVWVSMKARCYNRDHNRYHRYGGRGIRVCDRWVGSFENFLSDMGECPAGMQIDRKDNDGDYEPGNCQWSTAGEQANNRSTNRIVVYQDRSMTLAEASREYAVPYETLKQRLNRGWPVNRALDLQA